MKKLFKQVFVILMLISLTSVKVFAEENVVYTSGYFNYTVSNGSVTIVNYYGHDEEVIVPAMISAKPVNTIGKGAFVANEFARIVYLPSCITKIEEDAFREGIDISFDLPGTDNNNNTNTDSNTGSDKEETNNNDNSQITPDNTPSSTTTPNNTGDNTVTVTLTNPNDSLSIKKDNESEYVLETENIEVEETTINLEDGIDVTEEELLNETDTSSVSSPISKYIIFGCVTVIAAIILFLIIKFGLLK